MGGIINWMGGWPKEGLLSASEWEAKRAEWARSPHGSGAGERRGNERLREKLVENGLLPPPSEGISGILLAPGADAALERVARAWLAPGDAVLAERPTSRSALHLFRKSGASVHETASDEHGMLPEELSRSIARLRPRLVYAAPGGTDPEGRVWSEERRLALLRICAEADIPVLIDDRQAGLRYDPQPGESAQATLSSAAANGLPGTRPPGTPSERAGAVWTIGELPPGMIAGLRFGWLIGEGPVRRGAADWERARESLANGEPVPAEEQLALLALAEAGELEPLLLAMRFVCRAKLGLLIEQLEKRKLPGAGWREPQVGIHLWLNLPEGLDGDALLRAAWLNGLLFQPGSAFYAAGPERNRIRLTPVHSDERQIRAGALKLAETVGEFLGRWG